MDDWQHGGFGLYLHWPFCQSKCPYCDFNSHVADNVDDARWRAAYLSEIDRMGAETPGRVLDTVFFGGGTPSLMNPDTVAAIIARVRQTWPMVNDPEITLEANPGSVEAARLHGFRDAGVNRISMGIQALDDTSLRKLGRMHTVAEARAAFDIARRCFDRVSLDLIYARQDQSLAEWRVELTAALSMVADHLSLYQLTIEDGTVFGARHAAGKLRGLPDDGLSADMYALTQELCDAAGMPAYEVSNHARAGQNARHNMIYWRGGDYAGIGPGAHGRLTLDGQRFATEAPRTPQLWLQAVEIAGRGEGPRDPLTAQDRGDEYLMMALRLAEGADVARYRAIAGCDININKINGLIDMDMIRSSDGRLIATAQGRIVLNAVIRELLTG